MYNVVQYNLVLFSVVRLVQIIPGQPRAHISQEIKPRPTRDQSLNFKPHPQEIKTRPQEFKPHPQEIKPRNTQK